MARETGTRPATSPTRGELTVLDSWARISHAMGGTRTPRQVASRVQKYFEKLKRYGIEVEGS